MPDDQTGQPDQAATDAAAAAAKAAEDAAAADAANESPEDKAARLEAENATLKANSRKWEDRAKANKTKADEFDKLQQSSATDADKLVAALAAKEAAEVRLARYEVAAKTGLSSDLVEFLTATDEDAMEEQAKKLLARVTPVPPKKTPPKPDPSQGGGNGNSKVSAADEGRQEAQRRAALRKKS